MRIRAGELRMRIVGGKFAFKARSHSAGIHRSGDVRMRALTECVHARVRPARTMHNDALSGHFSESLLQKILDRVGRGLALPARVRPPIVGDDQSQPHACASIQLCRRICAAA